MHGRLRGRSIGGSQDCRLFLTSSEDATAKLWDIKSGKCSARRLFELYLIEPRDLFSRRTQLCRDVSSEILSLGNMCVSN